MIIENEDKDLHITDEMIKEIIDKFAEELKENEQEELQAEEDGKKAQDIIEKRKTRQEEVATLAESILLADEKMLSGAIDVQYKSKKNKIKKFAKDVLKFQDLALKDVEEYVTGILTMRTNEELNRIEERYMYHFKKALDSNPFKKIEFNRAKVKERFDEIVEFYLKAIMTVDEETSKAKESK